MVMVMIILVGETNTRDKEVQDIEEQYIINLEEMPDTIPILVENLSRPEDFLGEWDLKENILRRISGNAISGTGALYGLCNLRWNGVTIVANPQLQPYLVVPDNSSKNIIWRSTIDGNGFIDVVEMDKKGEYELHVDERRIPLYLPNLYHIYGAMQKNNKVEMLFIENQPLTDKKETQNDYSLKLLELDLVSGDKQMYNIENVSEKLMKYLTKQDFFDIDIDCINCITVDEDFFLYDEKSIYKINTNSNICKRIFSIEESITEEIYKTYPNIKQTVINSLGFYKGLILVEFIGENGLGDSFLYIPFIKEPVVYCIPAEGGKMYIFPNFNNEIK